MRPAGRVAGSFGVMKRFIIGLVVGLFIGLAASTAVFIPIVLS